MIFNFILKNDYSYDFHSKTKMTNIDALFNSIIKSNSIYHKIHPEQLLNQVNAYNNIDTKTPLIDPNTLSINDILLGQDKELYIVRPTRKGHIWIIIPRKQ